MRHIPLVVGTFAAAMAVPLAAGPAQAARPTVQITKIHYDSPGSDRGGNRSLNAEYITIRNNTKKKVSLKGWTIRDKANFRYTFGNVSLKPGKKLTLRTGQGRNGTATVYWNRRWYVWNNDRDKAYLRDAKGKLVDSCSYTGTRRGYTTC
ncbi:lamin tail domain-containing protein [Sphaerimonospora sp. CA-214678]|uniref:lamin tail domain-containing protein n=1 Tax=Sphaerimonospora sp. CA-214678 TaxID=3240029 RepID=UPI003D9233BE